MPSEKDFETALAMYPELIEEGLQLIGRQMIRYGRRMDLVFLDRFQRTLITELKWGPIKDEHMGQILSYEGILLSSADPTIRVMLIGNRVPPNLQKTMDHHGIAWKEITSADLVSFLRSKNDSDLLRIFEEAAVFPARRSQGPTVGHPGRLEASAGVAKAAEEEPRQSGDPFEQALRKCKNPDERSFFERARGQNQARTEAALRYDDARNRVRWYVNPQAHEARVVQKGRFTGDENFWKSRLSRRDGVLPKRITDGDADLRFHLVTAADFAAFEEVADREARVQSLDWEISRRRA